MDQKAREIRADDINPRHNWGRALPALGIMGVDFEERVDYRRLHRYRLARGEKGAGEIRTRRLARLRRQQHPLHHLDQDRRMGARQALALGAADTHGRADSVGFRLRRRASQTLYAVAGAGQLQGRARSACAAPSTRRSG